MAAGTKVRQGLAVAAAVLSLGWAAAAQEQPSTPADPPPAGTLEAPPERLEPGAPIGPPPAAGEGTLSDQLEESRGVIQPPPGVDPGIVEEPPPAGAFPTPVIPPSTVNPGAQPQR